MNGREAWFEVTGSAAQPASRAVYRHDGDPTEGQQLLFVLPDTELEALAKVLALWVVQAR